MLRLRRAVTVLTLLVATLVPMGCTTRTDPVAGSWVATEASPTAIVAGTQIILVFETGALRAAAGCNAISARTAGIAEGRLKVRDLNSGQVACAEDRGRQEGWLMQLLGSEPKAEISDGTLTIEGDVGRLRLVRK